MATISPPPRRSDTTRAAILDAARDRFASEGYERATIRAIAKDANIDPSMVMRYYGNKDKLFAAACELDLKLPAAAELSAEDAGERLVGHFLERWEADGTLVAMLRVAATNPAGAERLRSTFAQQLGPTARALSPHPDEAPHRAALAASQILGMALCRYVLALPPAVAMSHREVVAWLAPTLRRYLTAPRP